MQTLSNNFPRKSHEGRTAMPHAGFGLGQNLLGLPPAAGEDHVR